jgi:hypothetical protein
MGRDEYLSLLVGSSHLSLGLWMMGMVGMNVNVQFLSLLQCPWVAEIMDIITFVNCSVYYAKKN